MLRLTALGLRRTTSVGSVPRARPIIQFLLLSVTLIGLFVLLSGWLGWRGREPDAAAVQRSGSGAGGGLQAGRTGSKPAVVYHKDLGPLEHFILRRELTSDDAWRLCKIPGFAIRLMLVIPDDERGTRQHVGRVMAALQKVNYEGCQVHLLFLLPKRASLATIAMIDQLHWTAGKVYSRTWADSARAKDQVISAWTPLGDREFLIVLDRLDALLAIDERFMPFTLQCLSEYFVDGARGGLRKVSIAARRVGGISLAEAPRGPEVDQESQLLIQRGGGWTVYLSWFWRELAEYQQARTVNVTASTFENDGSERLDWSV